MTSALTRKIVLFLIAATSCIIAAAQNIQTAITNYSAKYAAERLYLHYDKSNYASGETIWFKIYLLKALQPTDESKTVYIDWMDEKGTVLQHTMSPVIKGVSSGQFDIPSDYKGKHIHVRSYTRWMLNFDAEFYYNKDIGIISKETGSTNGQAVLIPSLTLFPEGGDAIAGMQNKIAFKANDQFGRPVNVTGIIINNKGEVMDSLKLRHDGMGYFYLTPQPGISYFVKWTDENNVQHSTPIDGIKDIGVALQVIPSDSGTIFQVSMSPQIAKEIDTLHFVGTMYQHPVFHIARSTASMLIKAMVSTKKLATGILTITIFDNHWNAIAERISYVNNEQYSFTPSIEMLHTDLAKRGKNEIKITVPDSIISNLSVSVTDLSIGNSSNDNIISHLLLTGELKGNVYNPDYYFQNNSVATQQNLDLVMLTHGWRRIIWNQVWEKQSMSFPYARDTAYIGLSGLVTGIPSNQITATDSITFIVTQKGKEGQMLVSKLLPDGTFNDPRNILFDTIQLYYHLPEKKLKNISVQFVTGNLVMPSANYIIRPVNLNNDTAGNYRQLFWADKANIAKNDKIKILQNVTVKSSRPKTPLQLMDEEYTTGQFSGKDAYQFDLVNDAFAKSEVNVFTFLQSKVPGLQIYTSIQIDAVQIRWGGSSRIAPGKSLTTKNSDGRPQIYLNEMLVSPDFVASIPISTVAYIKVFRPMMSGFGDENGVICIYTSFGSKDTPITSETVSPNVRLIGYTPIREFYSPDYDSNKNVEEDVRTTLYWNPLVTTSSKQPAASLVFFNNDITKSFRVVVEGVTRDGKLAHVEQVIK